MYTFVALISSCSYYLLKHPHHTLPLLESLMSFKRTNFLTLKVAKSQVRDMALDIKTDEETMCYLVRTVTHLMECW
jgi:hypothetical protein